MTISRPLLVAQPIARHSLGVIAENGGLIRRRAKVSTINLRTEIAGRRGGGGGARREGLSRTVCRILSLYNLTPLLQKLRGKLKRRPKRRAEEDARMFPWRNETAIPRGESRGETRRNSEIGRMRQEDEEGKKRGRVGSLKFSTTLT